MVHRPTTVRRPGRSATYTHRTCVQSAHMCGRHGCCVRYNGPADTISPPRRASSLQCARRGTRLAPVFGDFSAARNFLEEPRGNMDNLVLYFRPAIANVIKKATLAVTTQGESGGHVGRQAVPLVRQFGHVLVGGGPKYVTLYVWY